MYILDVVDKPEITAWNPGVPGVVEVFHARFVEHRYPLHTHDSWTLLIVDSGAISYDMAGHEHGSVQSTVTLLPPHVPHDGRTVTDTGFRKRVIYLAPEVLTNIGSAVDTPSIRDDALRDRVDLLHRSLSCPLKRFEAQSRLAFVVERLQGHLRHESGPPVFRADGSLARRLRDLIDSRIESGVTLEEASNILHVSPTHLVRAFTHEFGIAPHRYLIGRRIDAARRMLLAGVPASQVATVAGFHDQAHLHRHFKRMVGTTPARFARDAVLLSTPVE